jgi:hypothetical protein
MGLRQFWCGRQVPKQVAALAEAVGEVSAGGNHTVAITGDGSIYTWGMNNVGQLGHGALCLTPSVAVAISRPAAGRGRGWSHVAAVTVAHPTEWARANAEDLAMNSATVPPRL